MNGCRHLTERNVVSYIYIYLYIYIYIQAIVSIQKGTHIASSTALLRYVS